MKVRSLSTAHTEEDIKKVKELSQQFESIFHGIMLKTMRSTVQKSGFIDGGNAEDIYAGMLDQEYSKLMSTSADTGLAANIERQLLESMGVNKDVSQKINALEGQKVYGSKGLHLDVKKATIKSVR